MVKFNGRLFIVFMYYIKGEIYIFLSCRNISVFNYEGLLECYIKYVLCIVLYWKEKKYEF